MKIPCTASTRELGEDSPWEGLHLDADLLNSSVDAHSKRNLEHITSQPASNTTCSVWKGNQSLTGAIRAQSLIPNTTTHLVHEPVNVLAPHPSSLEQLRRALDPLMRVEREPPAQVRVQGVGRPRADGHEDLPRRDVHEARVRHPPSVLQRRAEVPPQRGAPGHAEVAPSLQRGGADRGVGGVVFPYDLCGGALLVM